MLFLFFLDLKMSHVIDAMSERHKANNEVTRQSNLDSGHIFFRLVNLLEAGQIVFVLEFHLISSNVHMSPIVAKR